MKQTVKQSLDLVARGAERAGVVRFLQSCGTGRRRLLAVLTYHRVDEPAARPDLYPNLIGATPAEFASQMECIAEHFQAVSLQEVLDAVQRGNSLPPNAVLITFDDAYQDFADHAWPVLRKLQLPVTMFVPTAYPDQTRSFWWDRVYSAISQTGEPEIPTPRGTLPLRTPEQKRQAIRSLTSSIKSLPDSEAQSLVTELCSKLNAVPPRPSVMGWNQLRELAADGVTLAPHTRLHPLLNRVRPDRFEAEIAGSFVDLQREVGKILPVLAYPSGAYCREVVEVLPDLGIQLAFTTCRGVNDLDRLDPYRVRRVNVGRQTSAALLRTQLLSWNVHWNRWFPVPEGN
jgi:peptidoglycan/xylan/chitin deacetylase (PgdA/CDA1 family)